MEENNSQDLEIYFNYRDHTYKWNWQCIQGRIKIKRARQPEVWQAPKELRLLRRKQWIFHVVYFEYFSSGVRSSWPIQNRIITKSQKQSVWWWTLMRSWMKSCWPESPITLSRLQAASPGARPHLPRACSIRKLHGSNGFAYSFWVLARTQGKYQLLHLRYCQ